MSFKLKLPQAIGVALKGARGLTPGMFAARPLSATLLGNIETPIATSPEVDLSPGEEVAATVILPDDILSDASFTSVTAALLPAPSDSTPIHVSQRATVSGGDSDGHYDVSISIPTSPTNLSVRLQEGDAFWNFAATLTGTRYNFPDIAEPINQYLDRILTESGELALPINLQFMIQSSSSGKAEIAIYSIRYVRLKTESWTNDLDDTIRVDRNYSLNFAQSEHLSLEPIDNASELTLSSIRMDIGGEFGPERLLGNVVQHDRQEFAKVSQEYALALRFVLDKPVECAGIIAMLESEKDAEVYVEIQIDENGSPAVTEPLAKTTVTLSASEDDSGNWLGATFSENIPIEAGVPYWIVIKGIQGNVLLALQNQNGTYLTETQVNRGGQLWKPLHALPSESLPLLRLVYLPEIDNQTAAINIRLGESNGMSLPFDPLFEAQNLTIQPTENLSPPVTIVVESHAQGSLSIANIVQEYLVP